MDIIELRKINKRYDSSIILSDVSLSISNGQFFFLLGPSGCGKTTLLRIIAGLDDKFSGSVIFEGQDSTTIPAHLRRTPMVFQNYSLWPHMTVIENVRFGLELAKLSAEETHKRAEQALKTVQLSNLSRRYPSELSGGQQQRVALARAIALRPRAILLDEPLSNLDAKLRIEMRRELKRIQQELGLTMIYVTHDQTEALSLADKIAILNQGKIEQIGAPRNLYFEPNSSFVSKFIGDANVIEGTVLGCENQTATVDTQIGVIEAKTTGQLNTSEKVKILIRPNCFSISRSSGQIRALVATSDFAGSFTTLNCTTASGISLLVNASSLENNLNKGDVIFLNITANSTWIMKQ